MARRSCNDASSYSNFNTQVTDSIDKVIVIGILSTSDLKHAENLNGYQVVTPKGIIYVVDKIFFFEVKINIFQFFPRSVSLLLQFNCHFL